VRARELVPLSRRAQAVATLAFVRREQLIESLDGGGVDRLGEPITD